MQRAHTPARAAPGSPMRPLPGRRKTRGISLGLFALCLAAARCLQSKLRGMPQVLGERGWVGECVRVPGSSSDPPGPCPPCPAEGAQ